MGFEKGFEKDAPAAAASTYSYATIAAMMADGANRSDGDVWEITDSNLAGVFVSNAPAVHPFEMGMVASRYIGENATYGYSKTGDVGTDGNGDVTITVGDAAGDDVSHYLATLGSYSSEIKLNIPNLKHPSKVIVRVSLDITTNTAIRFGAILHDDGGNSPHCGVTAYDGANYWYKVTGPGSTGYSPTLINGTSAVDATEYHLSFATTRNTTGTGRIFGVFGVWGGVTGSGDGGHNMDASAANTHSLRIWASTTTGEFQITVLGISVQDPTGEAQS